jgi:KipI family sensor histidine kinase inhibitor
VRFQTASDCSLFVCFGNHIAPDVQQLVTGLLQSLERQPLAGQRNLHPGYSSLLIVFDPLVTDHACVEREVRQRADIATRPDSRLIEIPIHYDGPDLPDVARLCDVTEERVVSLHSGAEYLVYFVGFVPGFAYLGGLPAELTVPRLESPRKKVAAGSLGIAGTQTGIYPMETPGGWRLIGRTDLKMFEGRSLLQTGDHVRFRSVD